MGPPKHAAAAPSTRRPIPARPPYGRRHSVEPMTIPAHVTIDPAILYFGTPVVLLSSLNEDGTTNLMPMSSVWWLGRRAVLGIGAKSQTALNLERHPEVVMNLVSADLVR